MEEGTLAWRWTRVTKKKRTEPAKKKKEPVRGESASAQEVGEPSYTKESVRLDEDFLRSLLEFDNAKWRQEVKQRTKKLLSGKRIHEPTLEDYRVGVRFTEYITGIGFEWLLEPSDYRIHENVAKEFFTTFRFNGSTDLQEKNISFRIFGVSKRMSLNEFSIRMGLHTDQPAELNEWFGRDIGPTFKTTAFSAQDAWEMVTYPDAPAFKPSESRASHIRDPALRLAQVIIGCNLLGQGNTTSLITLSELYFLWCMKERRKVHLGYWIALSINSIARRTARHLNVCHLLGTYISRNWEVELMDAASRASRSPRPTLFNAEYLFRIQVLKKDKEGALVFYNHERRMAGADRRQTSLEQEEASPLRITEGEDINQEDVAPTPRATARPQKKKVLATSAPSTARRPSQVETLLGRLVELQQSQVDRLTQLAEDSRAHFERMSRLGGLLEQLVDILRDPENPWGRSPPQHPPRPSDPAPPSDQQ